MSLPKVLFDVTFRSRVASLAAALAARSLADLYGQVPNKIHQTSLFCGDWTLAVESTKQRDGPACDLGDCRALAESV
jgi:hypothetical protein